MFLQLQRSGIGNGTFICGKFAGSIRKLVGIKWYCALCVDDILA